MTSLNVANKQGAVTIAGVEISTDSEGRFNLNALHNASGLGGNKAPAQWLRTKSAQEVINELQKDTVQICIVSSEGRNGGTYAHQLLAVSYAGWISPAFQLQVNQAFIDYRTGKLSPAVDPMAALNDPEFLRTTLLTYSEKVIALEHKVGEMQPDVEALERISKADGSMCITNAAKHLQVQPKDLFKLMSESHWIYRRVGGKCWLAYQDRIQSGVLEHKVTTVSRSDGSEKVVEQVLVTAKGLTKLSKMMGVSGAAA
ncbi:phage antirepressor KilAC domain-containing protein [Serratia liquefaciens]|uniref:phage antirepressor KilAC domain-containing protein n=1 Tax=Serratia liquefaciens TaxID=614 RepID=UPI001F185868|nr:phage antirepressor KilAC domain-containing protein [Serratia liquefaciens]MCE9939795.1 phage antirepressor KilAC domain-containing protein [Serratia liquefaciens]